jgi:hypothetical protein
MLTCFAGQICRQFNDEIGGRWLAQTTYSFQSAVAVVDDLSQLSAVRVASVKRIRVVAKPLPSCPIENVGAFQ